MAPQDPARNPARNPADNAGQAQQLAAAFDAFNQMSNQLETSYRHLENQVEQLTTELAAARDERMQQLAEKERLANRLETLLQLLPAGVLLLDGQGRIKEHNTMAAGLLGIPLLGQSWSEVSKRAFAEQHITPADPHYLLKDGRRVSIRQQALDSEPGLILHITDITEHWALQDLVHRQERLATMGEMAAKLAHQVRTPLASALLYISHLRKPECHAADRLRFADKVHNRMQHLEHMVRDLLQFARDGQFDLEQTALQEVIEGFAASVQPQLEALDGHLHIDNQCPGVSLNINSPALQSALCNLADNAMAIVGNGVALHLHVQRNGKGKIEVALQDNGPGIDEAQRQQLFKPFFTTRSDGTGLGLAVVQSIVKAHQGTVRVKNSAQGGARFELELPCPRDDAALDGDVAWCADKVDKQQEVSRK